MGKDVDEAEEQEEEEEEKDDAIDMTSNIIRKPSLIMKIKHSHPVPVAPSMPATIDACEKDVDMISGSQSIVSVKNRNRRSTSPL